MDAGIDRDGAAEPDREPIVPALDAADLAEHLQLALEAGQMGTWRWDMSTGVTTWDATMERLFGLPEGGFQGSFDAWRKMLHPDDYAESLAVLDRAVAEKGSYEVDHRVVWPDGSIHWLRGRGKVTLDEAGNVTGTIGCSVDITDSKVREVETAERLAATERLMVQERLERERLEFLAAINAAALAAPDHLRLMTAVTRAAVPKLGDWCSLVFLPEPGADPLVEVAHSDPAKVDWAKALQQQYPYDPDGPTGVPAVVRTGVTEFVPVVDEAVVNAALDRTTAISREEALAILDALQLSSVITVPLLTRRGVVGALQVVNAESGRHYSERDVTLAEAAAGSIAVGLEGAWRADQQREVAVSLQSALLPPALPEIGGMTIASRYWPSGTVTEAGGDFYDVFEMDDHIWAVVIGDVCGTGPDAAGVTAIARHTIRAAACHGAPHGEVLEWANDAIHAGRRDRFCTAVYSTVERLNAGGWRYESVSGGHPLPLIARADGSTTTLGRAGDLLGVWPKIKTTLAGCEIGAGDAIVVYTDGLTDLRPPYDLDTAAMVELVTAAAAASTTAEQIADHLTAALDAVLPIAERSDDMALLVLRAD